MIAQVKNEKENTEKDNKERLGNKLKRKKKDKAIDRPIHTF